MLIALVEKFPSLKQVIDAGVSRVVVACEDPDPGVSGKGIKMLEEAGIGVDVGLLEDQARALNQGFIKRCEHGLPWVTIKMASSIDGRTAMASGQSQWVTTPDSRKDVQKLRAKSCAIITGIGTQMMDDPSLTVRISACIPNLSNNCGRNSPSSGFPEPTNTNRAGWRIEIPSRSTVFQPEAAESNKISTK